jgi:hypothetical protein
MYRNVYDDDSMGLRETQLLTDNGSNSSILHAATIRRHVTFHTMRSKFELHPRTEL